MTEASKTESQVMGGTYASGKKAAETPQTGLERRRFDHVGLRGFTAEVLSSLRVPAEDARVAADALVEADLMGIDSHGIAHLPWHPGYVKGLQRGWVNPRPLPFRRTDRPSLALLDGDGGMGVVVAHKAQELAMEKASATGVGIVAVANSRHFGAASVWTLKAAMTGMLGIVCSNGGPIVVPANGRERMMGTNPLSIAAPSQPHPFLLDFATSAVAGGKLEIAGREGKNIPEGWAVDADGNETRDASILRKGGSLLPLGSTPTHSWHKGYALSLAVEILAGLLSGGGTSLAMASDELTMCHLHVAVRIDAIRPLGEFVQDLTHFEDQLRRSRPIDEGNPVLVPGDNEFRIKAERLRYGIPLHEKVVSQLERLAAEVGVLPPTPL